MTNAWDKYWEIFRLINSSPNNQVKIMTNDKTKLELQKLELEIKELARPIWRRPAFLGAFLPLMLAIVGLASSVFTGFFDQRMAALREERQQLTLEIKDKKAEIESKDMKLIKLEDQIRDSVDQFKISVTEREIGKLLPSIRDYNDECENKHPVQNDTNDIEKLRARRAFYDCLISKLNYQVDDE